MLEIHGRAGCPFAWRARLAAAEKGVPFRYVAYDTDPPDAGAERNPDRKSPLLVDGEYSLIESAVIAAYIDEAYPGRPLQPADPKERAQLRLAVAELKVEVDTRPTASLTDDVRSKLDHTFTALDRRLADGREWLGGAEPSLADIHIWPFLPGIRRLGYEIPASLQRARAYADRAAARPSVVETAPRS